jgi:signal peptidase II
VSAIKLSPCQETRSPSKQELIAAVWLAFRRNNCKGHPLSHLDFCLGQRFNFGMARIFRFRIHRLCLILSLLFLTVGCDQMTKVIARDVLQDQTRMAYLNQSLIFVHAENPGAFMSMGADLHHNTRYWIFSVCVLLFLAFGFWMLFRRWQMDKWQTIAWSLILGGGAGNLIDRFDKGTVTDFINLRLGSWRTGIFNVADMVIVAGVLLLLIHRSTEQTTRSRHS